MSNKKTNKKAEKKSRKKFQETIYFKAFILFLAVIFLVGPLVALIVSLKNR